jgi:predicted transcriptional regulator
VLVKDIMTTRTAQLRHDSHLYDAAEVVAQSGASDLMVVDYQDRFLGVLSEGDILRAALPDMDEILEAGGTLEDAYRVFLAKGKALSERLISPLVIQDPIVLSVDDHVAAATVILVDRMIRRLPVVEKGKLVGTLSRSDVCRGIVGSH